ncbi:integrase (plasmid) [Bryobacterales bacterium F-183]|nr:integrase [Bryobacterales bacterium F-183]
MHIAALTNSLPAIVRRSGSAAVFAAEEFFYGAIRNEHTRAAYRRAIVRFLAWAEAEGLELARIAPRDVGQYLAALAKSTSITTRKQHLSALRHFFDALVTRHAILLNPALSVRGERYSVVEGKTPEISAADARTLLQSIPVEDDTLTGLRDRALLAVLIYTASRAGAVAGLRRGDLYRTSSEASYQLHFAEKGGKSREIPVREDLARLLFAWMDAAGLRNAPKTSPLFPSFSRKTQAFTDRPIHVNDVCRMMKRRLRAAGLPDTLSPHSFRVATITNLLEQGVPLEDVQRLAGHADPRTTRLYDRRDRKITRNLVERITI